MEIFFLLQFYSEVSEAEVWMREKQPLVTSVDYGKDEMSVVALTKKLDNLARDMDGFRATIDKLNSLCQKLTERRHFDSENISKKMVREYTELYCIF